MTWCALAGKSHKYATNLYHLQLGVAVDADDTELKKAYRKQAMKVCWRIGLSRSAGDTERYIAVPS
jgi:hypothetical protein